MQIDNETATKDQRTNEDIVAQNAVADREHKLKQLAQAQHTVNSGYYLKELAIATKMYTNSLIKGRRDEVPDGGSKVGQRWLGSSFPDIHTYGPFGPRY